MTIKPYYQSDRVTLYHGDCLAILPTLEAGSVDAVVTDPPYGVKYDGGHFHSGDVNIKRSRDRLRNDEDADIYSKLFPLLHRVVDGPCYVFYASTQADRVIGPARASGFDIHASIIWNKPNATYASMGANYKNRYEPLLYCKPKGSTLKWCGPTNERTVWDIPREPRCHLHPTQKPVAVCERAIRNHNANTILDPFVGSGTTGVACVNTGRKFIGIEIDEKYCEIAAKRIQAAERESAERLVPA